ncbi:calmodulin-binding transcription activator 3 isoform X3 [Momordica charantia]|uniref:Calmodulin-binding transcription activator 3 isoform X3 n=1 Tax=Momordica charantia TaxID=3673 RepID=A0A6J1C4H4_MOMCH|nr:calmodulin-binding transcription activator 3 isoform X3 [Momordica charantia]
MAENRCCIPANPIGIEQILLEAQHRWLRPAEICEILNNYEKFSIASEPANMPPSGSLFLYDRKVLRYFRKDGHNWRKKKDGKAVKEAHERLKAGSVYALHCYYAHGEENENFQRRTYWLLEEDLSHIVLVHYREVQSSRANLNRNRGTHEAVLVSREFEETTSHSEMDASNSSSFHPSNYQIPSQTTEISLNSAQVSEYEDVESEYSSQASTVFHSFLGLQRPRMERFGADLCDPNYPISLSDNYQENFSVFSGNGFPTTSDRSKDNNSAGLNCVPQKNLNFSSENVLESGSTGIYSSNLEPSLSASQPEISGDVPKQGDEVLRMLFTEKCKRKEFNNHLHSQEDCQTSQRNSSPLVRWPIDQQTLQADLVCNVASKFHQLDHVNVVNSMQSSQMNTGPQNDQSMQEHLQQMLPNTKHEYYLNSISDGKVILEGKANFPKKQPLLDAITSEGLKKSDSFNQWMNRELGDVNEASMQSNSGAYWNSVENEVGHSSISSQVHPDAYMFSPSLSHEQLFSIIDFSPSWAYEGSEIKVLLSGRFLTSHQEVENSKWSCMFGEVEVPAEIIANGVLRCFTPIHKAGRVPFYVTCSNRLACSEVREFEYRVKCIQNFVVMDDHSSNTFEALALRFVKLLCLSCPSTLIADPNSSDGSSNSNKISELLKEDKSEWGQLINPKWDDNFSFESAKELLLQNLLKEKLHVWLLQKVREGGKGPSVLDEHGQGVLHFAAALNYDWALLPSIVAGINVNFRDANGWTALHWAAFFGRERVVAALISMGAAPGLLTDPSPKHPSGRTPADLASLNGHKGIAGYLAESDLSARLESLAFDSQESKSAETCGARAVQTATERVATPHDGNDIHTLSLKDSLAAVSNATQAAARIHEVMRVQSFQRKQLELKYRDDRLDMLHDQALSVLAVKRGIPGPHDKHAAAIRIQNKFRSWKNRKDFLIIRQRIVKIQAHVRGHQVRKNYRTIVWSVGILEKLILRWRRKGSGLRGFKPEAPAESSKKITLVAEDDDDFLKQGRKQTEERLQKALARVKSMVQYPEARDQYRRLLNVVSEMQEIKVVKNGALDNVDETADFDDLIDIETLLGEDNFMPTAI